MTQSISFEVLLGGREYHVPRAVSADGGAAAEAWLAEQLLQGAPAEEPSTRADLEAEAARLGLAVSLPDEAAAHEPGNESLLVRPSSPGKTLVNADFSRAIAARRAELVALLVHPDDLVNEAPDGAAAETDGDR